MGQNDELLEEELELILGGTPEELNREINLIASSEKTIEEKKKLINDIRHKILTGKINVETTRGKKR